MFSCRKVAKVKMDIVVCTFWFKTVCVCFLAIITVLYGIRGVCEVCDEHSAKK